MSSVVNTAGIPSQIAQFEIVRRLGAGGMAEVFLAKKRGAEGTFKVVVVKRILPAFTTSRRFRSMFIDEAQLATRLNHPNVVQVYEFSNEGDEGHILAMEYVEGCDLGHLMSAAKAKGRLIPPWASAWIVAEAAKGLHYAHDKRDEGGAPLDIVHRDVSPQNVLLSFEGVVKIADFGIASARLTDEEEGVLKGKFGYMSPEQARGEKVDRRGDLYALGVIFWECLTGRPLHGGLGGEALLDIVRSGKIEAPSTYVRDIPEELETIVLKLLSQKPEDRYPTGRDVAAAIGRAMLLKQMFVDSATLENTLLALVPREGPALTGSDAPPEHHTQAAAPHALSSGESGGVQRGSRPPLGSVPPQAGLKSSPPSAAGSRRPEAREVRHVAIVTLRLVERGARWEGEGEPPPLSDEQRRSLVRALERSRGMLGDMAYKRGMRWVWTSDLEARAIAGLGPKPAKAASDAAWLAVETHEAIDAIKEDLPSPVGASLSIVRGIASGTRDPEGNLVRYVLHDPVSYLADVLARATPPKGTWVAGGVYRLVRRDFRWGDAPTLDLKTDVGVPERVQNLPPTMRIYALERSLSREEKAAEQANTQNDLIGRDAEKAELHGAYHAAVNGPGGGLVSSRAIVGEMGIGKTALVATFLSELPPNTRLVRTECTPVRMEVPYSALADLVRDAIGASGDESYDEIAHLIARAGGGSAQPDITNPMVARLAEIAANTTAGAAQSQGEDEDAHYRKKVLVSGVRHLVAAIALDQPLVFVIDGLQWADKPTLDLMTELLKTPDPLPVLSLLVTRPDDRVASLLEGKVRIELHALSSEEQIRLVEARLSVKEGVRQVCAELMPRVGGNPFYLLEMIDALLERGVLEIRDDTLVRPHGADLDSMGLPSTLEQLLADRIQELPGPEHVVVDWLAIAGGPLGLADLAKLNARAAQHRGAAPDPSSADVVKSALRASEDAIMRLCARGLCDRKGDVLDFRHPLTRDVAYAALEPMTRSRMHRALGQHLAETSLARGVSAAIVARHLVRGDAPERAAHFYQEAANAARNAYQTQLAIRYYLRAAQHLASDDPQIMAVHEALENIFRVLGRKRERVRHLEIMRATAKSIAAPRAVCLALLRTARYDLDEGHLSHGLPVARRAAAVAHSAQYPNFEIEAELLVSELARETGDVQGALAASDRALAACNPKVNPGVPARVRADVLRTRGVLLRRVGRVREAVDAYVEAIGVFRKVGARRQEARAKNALAYAMFVQGRYEDAIALALESIRIDLSIGGRFQLAKTLTNIGHSYARLGDMARAQAYLKRAREAHERYGDQDGRADTLLVSAEVMLELGEAESAYVYVKDALQIAAATGNAYDLAHGDVVAAALARYRRDAPLAIQHALSARRSAEQQALVAYHFYAFAVEAAARVDAGEVHAATLLATTALGAVEALQGCEYGLEIRVLCADALKRAASPQAPAARQRAVDYAAALMGTIRDARLKRRFAERPLVTTLFDSTPMPHAVEGER
jgi:serine/threonine protein kinase/tetratricopeptide (TPR) repeat protein